MLSPRYSLLLVSLVVLLTFTANAQTPREALEAYNRGYQHYLKGDFDRAIADFTLAIDLSSRPAGSSRNRNWRASMGFTSDPSDSGQITFIDPLTAVALSNRALVRLRKGDLEGALADCDRGLAINPGLLMLYNNRGAIRWAMGNLAGAIADFDQVIAKNPRDASAYNARGHCHMQGGDLARALADFDQAIHWNPRSAEYRCDRGHARFN